MVEEWWINGEIMVEEWWNHGGEMVILHRVKQTVIRISRI